ncbi:MAG: type III-B CRISPR module-associated protein Cmr5 [Acidobacteriota bacterium]|nr:type III-B CRISPR module-associated protein Cmr5 [Acidobacteriota bacterium]
MPVLIRTAGLAQALAFVDARGSEAHKLLLAHLAQLVFMTAPSELKEKLMSARDERAKLECYREFLLERSRAAELEEYRTLTQRAMAALLWYKRFAQSVLEIKLSDTQRELDSPTA